MSRIFPRPLTAGDTVAVVSPAGPPRREPIERAIGQLEQWGLRVKTYGDIFRATGYLAGSDDDRADELMAAFDDPAVAAVLPTRGGNGLVRIVDRLDYGVIARNPKLLVGFSDLTALHLAILTKTNLVTWHGPHLQDGLGAEYGLCDVAQAAYKRMLFTAARPGDMLISNDLLDAAGDEPFVELVDGVARGRLVGGNLSLICALMGTHYEIDTQGAVLLLEEIAEEPYRIDRFLAQLRLAGKLSDVAAVLLGHFTNCAATEGKPSATCDEILAEYFGDFSVPVVRGFPSGHDRPNVALPLGVEVELDTVRGSLRLAG